MSSKFELPIMPNMAIHFENASTSLNMKLELKKEEIEDEEEEEEVQRIPIVGELTENRIQYCHVCNNQGATYHYGGTVCAGCKIFFSRAVRDDRNYLCRKDGFCRLNGQKKGGKCQGCRFASCLRAGMQKENVGRLLLLRMIDHNNTAPIKEETSICSQLEVIPPTSIFTPNLFSKFLNSSVSLNTHIQRLINLEKSKENRNAMPFAYRFKRSFSAKFSLSDSLHLPQQICEPVPMDFIRSKFREKPQENMKWFWCRNTAHFLEWASAIEDLMTLKYSEVEKILRSQMISVMTLVTCYGFFHLDRENDSMNNIFGDIEQIVDPELSKQSIFMIIEPMAKIQLKLEEMVILKLILLFDNKPDYKRKYYNMLRVYLEVNNSEGQSIERLLHLMMILNSVRQISNLIDNWLLLLCTTNQYEMRDQLIEEFHLKN